MNRARFLKLLAALPFLGWIKPAEPAVPAPEADWQMVSPTPDGGPSGWIQIRTNRAIEYPTRWIRDDRR